MAPTESEGEAGRTCVHAPMAQSMEGVGWVQACDRAYGHLPPGVGLVRMPAHHGSPACAQRNSNSRRGPETGRILLDLSTSARGGRLPHRCAYAPVGSTAPPAIAT